MIDEAQLLCDRTEKLVDNLLSAGVVLTRDQLPHRVWQQKARSDDEKTADQHVRRLRRKIESASTFRKIDTVWEIGYKLVIMPRCGISVAQAAETGETQP